MMVLVTYDVSTINAAGRKRLQQVAKCCLNYGQRVQNSVFECIVTTENWVQFRHELVSLIEPKSDSLRFYFLGRKWRERIEHVGANPSIDLEGPLIV